MIGTFESGLPLIDLEIEGYGRRFILDTGFTGDLMLPASVITLLELKQIEISKYLTASGEEVMVNVFKGSIDFFGRKREIAIIETMSGLALAGMHLFHACRIIIERHKGLVEVVETGQ